MNMSEQPALPEQIAITEVQVLRLQPGDVLAVHVDKPMLTAQEAAWIRARWMQLVPGHAVMVLGPGITLEAVRPDTEEGDHDD